jgi:TonB family protein
MKTFPMLTIVIGVLLSGSLLAQASSAPSDWQSLDIRQTAGPLFPYRLMQLGVTQGEAQVAVNTDATGKLVEWLVIGYTQPEFADAAVAAIKHWEFKPARLRGEPIGTVVELVFYFEARGVVVSSANLVEQFQGRLMRITEGRYTYRPCSLRELDRLPVPTVTVAPHYSTALAAQGVKGSVTVEFFIDETGTVRMPAASAKDDTALTALAVDALSQWKFSPPTSRGKGVLVKASQEFDFKNGG